MSKRNKEHRKKGLKAKKAGLPPGALMYVGDKEDTKEVKIGAFSFNKEKCSENLFYNAQEALASFEMDSYTWLNVNGLTNVKEIVELGKFASIHNLFLEDILDTDHRPKIEMLNNEVLVILKMIHYKENKLTIEHLALILGRNYLISFQEFEGDIFNGIRKKLREDNSLLRSKNIDYLLFTIMDTVVDNYFIVLDKLTDRIEDFEDQIIMNPKDEMIIQIQDLKREAMNIRRSIYPLREVISKLQKTPHFEISSDTLQYFTDLYEHIIHVVENLDVYRDMLLGLMDMYMSSMSNRMNNIMKVLTIMSTIFIPMTFIAGVYGMNFEYMEFLKNPYGYEITWAVMIGIAIVMLIYYKHKKWL